MVKGLKLGILLLKNERRFLMKNVPENFVGATEERCKEIVEFFYKIVKESMEEEMGIEIPFSVTANKKAS